MSKYTVCDGCFHKDVCGNWVSVETRLPEKFKSVLIYANSTAGEGSIMLVGACDNGYWFIQNSQAALGFPNLQYEVTRWAELPPPPKED